MPDQDYAMYQPGKIPTPPKRKGSSFTVGVINTMNMLIGAGILSMPYSTANLGYVMFPIYSLIVGFLSFYTVDLLVQACDVIKRYTYEEIAEEAFYRTFGKRNVGRKIVGTMLFITSIGACLSYGFIIKSQSPELLKTLLLKFDVACVENASSAWFFDGNILYLIITICITLPITMARHLDFLKYPSLIGMLAMFATIVIIVCFKSVISCKALVEGIDLESSESSNQNQNQFVSNKCGYSPNEKVLNDWSDFSKSLQNAAISKKNDTNADYCVAEPLIYNEKFTASMSTLFYSWMSHAGILTIYDSLQDRSRRSMQKVLSAGYIVNFIMNLLIGIFGYLTWYEMTISDVLLLYSSTSSENIWIFFTRLFVNLTVLFSIPILLFMGRVGFFNIFKNSSEGETEDISKVFTVVYNLLFLGLNWAIVSFLADSLGKIIFVAGLINVSIGFELGYFLDKNRPK